MKVSLDTIKTAISDPKTKVVSFDVFDTLLVRPFWYPTDLFFFLDKEIEEYLESSGVIYFSSIRKDAEREAREKALVAGREDVTLQEIYDRIEETGVFPKEAVRLLKQKEMELELRFCTARKSAKDLVEFAVNKGKKIVATSDMYLPSAFIMKILKKNGYAGNIEVFVSCETGVAKWTGNLYEHVLNQLHVSKDEFIHIGDNGKADVKIPRRLGIRAFPYYRTIDMLAGQNGIPLGTAFQKAYKQMRSALPHQTAMENLGTRCMLAVAANRVYDDPFRKNFFHGDYAGDTSLFGNLALGMYCMAQAMWLDKITKEEHADRILFFARDGFLPYKGFEQIQRYRKEKTETKYVRSSRKALVPLLFTSKELLLTAGSHLNFFSNSPKSVVKLMRPVLIDKAGKIEEKMGESWEKPFPSELSMMEFLLMLYDQYLDEEKLKEVKEGYRNYFASFMSGKIVTYDIGYSLRNETILHYFFPDVQIMATCTHITGDTPLKRSMRGEINMRTVYTLSPYVTWLAREMFMIENAPSCLGYSSAGEPVLGEQAEQPHLLQEMHEEALGFMEAFCSTFKEDIQCLPMEYISACLPFEAFLHSPGHAALKWVKNLDEEDSFDTGVKDYTSYNFWRELRTDYWIARHHLGKYRRHAVRFVMLTYTDREELKQLIRKRIPEKILKRMKL